MTHQHIELCNVRNHTSSLEDNANTTQKATSLPIKHLKNTSKTLFTIAITIAAILALVGVGLISAGAAVPSVIIAGAVCIALGVTAALTSCFFVDKSETKKQHVDIDAAPSVSQTDDKKTTDIDQVSTIHNHNNVPRVTDLVPASQKDKTIFANKIANKICNDHHISPVLSDKLAKQLQIYVSSEKNKFYLSVPGDGLCFFRSVLINITCDYRHALSDDSIFNSKVDIIDIFKKLTQINLFDIYQSAKEKVTSLLTEQNIEGIQEDLNLMTPDLFELFISNIFSPKHLLRLEFPNSGLNKISKSKLIQEQLLQYIENMPFTFDRAQVKEDLLNKRMLFKCDNDSNVELVLDMVNRIHTEYQFVSFLSDSFFNLLLTELGERGFNTDRIVHDAEAMHYLIEIDDADAHSAPNIRFPRGTTTETIESSNEDSEKKGKRIFFCCP